MRTLLVRFCCAAAIAISAASFFTPTPAQAWGYRHYGYYRPYAFAHVYRPRLFAYRRFYRPHFFAYRPFYRPYYAYRPYRAYAYAGVGPRIWVGWGRRWWW